MTYWAKVTDYIKDKYLTWRTGKDRQQREWEAWYEVTVVYRANDITNMFKNFKHIVAVNPDKFFNPYEPFAWVPNKDAKQYFWPERTVETTCVWRFERVMWDQWSKRWSINELGGEDKVFVATNNDRDALMIALKYS